ncbi:TPA: GMC family oxidoreductase N-terminal domain-containing protein [Legionella pneumophila]|nr:GMC family oxidoreductase N-terminal domain-containing protein [Legionella pneumophila]HDO9829719.1 GMC family oxidoreductase N-terminal domain-containing protein [Legionella pneumophila]
MLFSLRIHHMEFDYIIFGDGSPGWVFASRLSANPANKLLLLEAGDSIFLEMLIRLQ